MNILSIIGIFSSMFNIGAADWISEIFNKALLFFDGFAYTMLAYSFKLFQLMCTLNFNSLQGLISPVLTNIKALVMVFVVYKLGISLINFMLNPDEAAKKGKEMSIQYAKYIKYFYNKCLEALEHEETSIIIDRIDYELLLIIKSMNFKIKNSYEQLEIILNEKSLMELQNKYIKAKDVEVE